MKTILKYSFCIIISFIYSQNKQLSVIYTKSTDNLSQEERLVFNNDKVLYTSDSIYKKTENQKTQYKEDENTYIIPIKDISIPTYTYHINLSHDSIYFNIHKNLILDVIPEFKWKIDSLKTKKVGNYNCYQAKTNFRGSKIIAYFTYEIPFSIGPWKFKGLPGAILELHTNSPINHSWIAKKIIFPYEENIKFDAENTNKAISLQHFNTLVEKEIAQKMRVVEARMPNGVKKGGNNKMKRNNVEQIYEWEEE